MKRILTLLLLSLTTAAFAGDNWKTVTAEQEEGLLSNEIQFLQQDKDKKIWIGTTQGLSLYENGKFSVYKKGGEVYDVFPLGGDKYLIGTSNGALLMNQGKVEKHIVKGHRVVPICKRADGSFWLFAKHNGTEVNSVFSWNGEKAEAIEALKDHRVKEMFQASNGDIWISVDGNGVLQIPAKESAEKAKRHLPAKQVSTVFEDSKGKIWCGLWGPGIMVYDDGKWTFQLKKETAVKFNVVEDTKGQIWVSTNESGLWQYDGKKWTNHLKDEGSVNMLEATSDGKVWISTQSTGGLRCWNGKEWVESLPGPLPVRCLLETADKQLWAGGVLDGLHIKK